MLRSLRVDLGLSRKEFGDKLAIPFTTVKRRENTNHCSPEAVTDCLERLDLPEDWVDRLQEVRKSFWKYDESLSPQTNELIRIRMGLGRTATDMSRILGRNDGYWSQLEYRGKMLGEDELDMLEKQFRLSSSTIRRHRVIVERMLVGKSIPEGYKTSNPEIQEPEDLYDGQDDIINPERYMALLHEIEDENGGSILGASEEDPKLTELREMMGVIYYDE